MTSAERLQFEVWRRMTSVEKSAAFLDLQSTAIALAEAGIRRFAPRSRRAVLGDSTSTTKAGADVILALPAR